MNKVKIKFKPNTIIQEINRVSQTIDKMDFFMNNNYQVFLPKVSKEIMDKIEKCKKLSDLEKEKIKVQIKKEHKSSIKQKKILKIKKFWIKNIEQKFFNNITDLLKIKPLKEYTIYLTQYGCGGSYWPPNKAIVNINLMCTYTVAHEILHLMIEDLIQKYKISHWQKERIVDLYMSKIFDDYGLQNIDDRKGVKKVDKIFKDSHALGVEKMIKMIKK